ncbi:MAG: hypothetical protein L3J91_06570, partial [Thermoplasmata archaeon]|nr:hypothetical protein [Thermoplasmata archaeon]
LATVKPLTFSMILLKSEHAEYEIAARELTRLLGGSLVVTDPGHLGVELLIRWARGTETIHRAPPTSGEASRGVAPPPAVGGKRRRRADRRMGG